MKSMTGFGRCEISRDDRKFTVEIKSVNHRYLDVNIRMPKKFNFFEGSIRNLIKKHLQRGKIDLFITYEDDTEDQISLQYNQHVASEYMKYFKKMESDFGITNDIMVSHLSKYPEVLYMEEQEINVDEIWSTLEEAILGAVQQLVETREREGEHLKDDLIEKLDGMLEAIHIIEERSPQILLEYRKRLESKVKEFLTDVSLEESRIAAEVIVYADKVCTDEEVVRLKSHVKNMKATSLEEDSIGRKMDFIAQEMNREANTILSKANDLEVSNIAIALKTDIEKIREQIQNIE
ncbi:MAG TPA: YicC family protein [Candidatus Merdenecus merdavium]|nr:YicC family protein [Candidatus Merdenecus merdavium]